MESQRRYMISHGMSTRCVHRPDSSGSYQDQPRVGAASHGDPRLGIFRIDSQRFGQHRDPEQRDVLFPFSTFT